jgi:two-component system, response regulator PdtaR
VIQIGLALSLTVFGKFMFHRKTVILVVEDNVLIRLGAIDFLVAAGFDALEADSADEAIRILERRRDIRLVFTDIEMPGTIDGLKLAHYVWGRWPKVRLIVASGKMLVEQSHLPEGARFFSKPYSDTSIIAAMRGMLGDETERHASA